MDQLGNLLVEKRNAFNLGLFAAVIIAIAVGAIVQMDPWWRGGLLIAGLSGFVLLIRNSSVRFRFHEHGFVCGERVVLYREISQMSVDVIREHTAATHVTTEYAINIDGIRARLRVLATEPKLGQALERMARVIADRLEADGQDTRWGDGSTLKADSVESISTPSLLGKAVTVSVPYLAITDLGFVNSASDEHKYTKGMKRSYRQFQLRGASATDVVRIQCCEPNFHPGYQLLCRRLKIRLPEGGSLSP